MINKLYFNDKNRVFMRKWLHMAMYKIKDNIGKNICDG